MEEARNGEVWRGVGEGEGDGDDDSDAPFVAP